jgi:hypothetical protein
MRNMMSRTTWTKSRKKNKPDDDAKQERSLRCLGAAVILHWNSLASQLQKELFAAAGDMDDLMQTKSVQVGIRALPAPATRMVPKSAGSHRQIESPELLQIPGLSVVALVASFGGLCLQRAPITAVYRLPQAGVL